MRGCRVKHIYSCGFVFVSLYWFMAQALFFQVMRVEGSTDQAASKSFMFPINLDPLQFLNLEAGVWSDFKSLINATKGYSSDAIAHLKLYFAQFGYLDLPEGMIASADFDDAVEAAIRLYQQWFGLPITGILDLPTLYQLIQPRCGRADVLESFFDINDRKKTQITTGIKHYSFFPGNPVWTSKRSLTYAFSPSLETTRVSTAARTTAFAEAFAQWSAVVPLTFKEISSYDDADIKIEFADGDHSDGQPFDGMLGILAHSFSPEDGRFHLDNAEYWTADMTSEKSPFAMDLESVAVHEIGHLIGLGHSSAKNAIMFPSLSPREVKRQLVDDDIQGSQSLYGASQSFQGSTDSFQSTNQTANGVFGRFLDLWLCWFLLTIHLLASFSHA
ncbi:hypothetical protein O6H91_Y464300 [Diphasiastrum complanatum]|nr:hypothetical protein O6H91_Y464300 [Diphasiastrum complanatum]